jgi:uncharacterized protein (UPF0332 family)
VKPKEIETLIKYRLEQAQAALDDAKYLIDGKRSPQSIINRSYYAMFYAALALLQNISKVPSKHSGVISLFDTEFVMKGVFPKDLSKDFHKAFELRQTVDYKVIRPITFDRAKEAWSKATDFVQEIQRYLLGEKLLK